MIGFPYIVVNSEKYIFSSNVLKSGEQLLTSFGKLRDKIRDIYHRFCEESIYTNINRLIKELRHYLEDFDKSWSIFEKVTSIKSII